MGKRKRRELPLLHSVEITGVAAEGKALAKLSLNPDRPEEKLVLFVPYAAPGDVADIKVDRRKHSFAEGHIDKLVEPSPLRIEPRCEHFGVCGGCKWQHMPYREQLKFKQQQVVDALTRIGHLDLPEVNPILGCETPFHYRNKMEYTFSNRRWRTWEEIQSGQEFDPWESCALGFHIPGQFDKVLHLNNCHLQDPLGDRIRNFIYQYAVDHRYSFYDLKGNAGLLRTLMLRILTTGQVMVCLSFGEDDREKINDIMEATAAAFPEITSLLYVINTKANDTIFDLPVHVFKGQDYVEEKMEDLTFRISPKSFYQTNSRQAYLLYSAVRRMAGLQNKEGERPLVYDLYTGTGTIAQFVARGARHVIGIEYVPEAVQDAAVNAAVNGIENTTFLAGDMKDILTDEFVAKHGRPDVMIIDPPRAGMHPDVVDVILDTLPQTIVYVSCNPATQARDLALLAPRFDIVEVQPVDMFPHTHHVENIVKLTLKP